MHPAQHLSSSDLTHTGDGIVAMMTKRSWLRSTLKSAGRASSSAHTMYLWEARS